MVLDTEHFFRLMSSAVYIASKETIRMRAVAAAVAAAVVLTLLCSLGPLFLSEIMIVSYRALYLVSWLWPILNFHYIPTTPIHICILARFVLKIGMFAFKVVVLNIMNTAGNLKSSNLSFLL